MTLSAIFYPCHFVRTILSIPFCPIPFYPYTILSIPFCPYHCVRYHFVLEPWSALSYRGTSAKQTLYSMSLTAHVLFFMKWHLVLFGTLSCSYFYYNCYWGYYCNC